MTNNSDLPIIGKSVEEIEADQGNRENSAVPREDRLDDMDGLPGLMPAAGPGNGVMMTGAIPQVIMGTELADRGSGPEERRTDAQPDSDESGQS